MRVAWLCVAILLFGATDALAAKITLPGQVTYRERIALPDSASLEIQLIDQTLSGAPPRVDVKASIGAGSVPLSFNLVFENTIIIPSHSYALIAAISSPEGLLFRNFEPYPVNPLAPAAPVLIVANMVAPLSDVASSSAEPAAPPPPAIFGVNWTAASIGDAPVLPRTTPSLTIGSDLRAGGSGGCNSWIAQAALDRESLHFGATVTTQKSCALDVNIQERAFSNALAATASWRVTGDVLTLYGADGGSLAVFRR